MKTCSRCGASAFTKVAEDVDREGVVVHERFTCDSCGAGYRENVEVES